MTDQREKKRPRRASGLGSLYQMKGIWWIAYKNPEGRRQAESSGSKRKGDAEKLLRRRIGAVEHNLPVIPRAEKLTFNQAAQAMLDDFTASGKKSLVVVRRRIKKHLTPFFNGRRMAGITTDDVTRYVAARRRDQIVVRKARTETLPDGTTREIAAVTKPVSAAEINRELQTLKRMFNLAIDAGKIAMKPKIALLREAPARTGFFEPDQLAAVLHHLPASIQPVIRFAAITGWRIHAEVLPLEWRNVDFPGGEVRLDAERSKNGHGRVFPMTAGLREVLTAQHADHLRLKLRGVICPYVFFREVAQGRGGAKAATPITAFTKAWKTAVRLAGCPGRLPHDLRRTAVRSFVRAGASEHVAMKLSGHKTASVFRRYDIVSGDDLKEAARRLDRAAGIVTDSAMLGEA
jgi:integrase